MIQSHGGTTIHTLQASLHPSREHDPWHGNVEDTSERLDGLLCELDRRENRSTAIATLSRSVTEFDTYIRNHRAFIPKVGERYR